MTLTHPARLARTSRAPATSSRRAHRHHRPGTVSPLLRAAPSSDWDPLAVDAEGSPPRLEYGLPPPEQVPPAPVEDLCTVAGIITKAVAEVLLGIRPPAQIQTWLVEDVWHVVRRRASLGARSRDATAPASIRIIRVHPCPLDERTCEASVVLHDGGRVRGAALRLALHRGRWRATAIRIG